MTPTPFILLSLVVLWSVCVCVCFCESQPCWMKMKKIGWMKPPFSSSLRWVSLRAEPSKLSDWTSESIGLPHHSADPPTISEELPLHPVGWELGREPSCTEWKNYLQYSKLIFTAFTVLESTVSTVAFHNIHVCFLAFQVRVFWQNGLSPHCFSVCNC